MLSGHVHTRMYPNILRLSMFMRLREGQWTLLVSSCLRSTNRVNLRAREHADSQNIWIHPRILGHIELTQFCQYTGDKLIMILHAIHSPEVETSSYVPDHNGEEQHPSTSSLNDFFFAQHNAAERRWTLVSFSRRVQVACDQRDGSSCRYMCLHRYFHTEEHPIFLRQ